jgi:SOS response regulatory protein OraA/RecX
MARIVSVQKGAHDLLKASVEGGSLFSFRLPYFQMAVERYGREADEAGPLELEPGAALPDAVLGMAAEAMEAEKAALALVARAEQSCFGLRQKLSKRKLGDAAIGAAIDFLRDRGLVSDTRFAGSWIRQRVRRRAEGPTTLRRALSARGIGSADINGAFEAELSGDARFDALETARRLLAPKHGSRAELRHALRALGYGSAEIDDCFDALDSASQENQ